MCSKWRNQQKSHIVGYQSTSVTEYFSIKVGTFKDVAGEGYSIQSIKPKGSNVGGGVFDMQTLDDAGGCVEQFYYMTEEDGVEIAGWYNEDGETLATKVFKTGEGYMINNTTGNAAASMQAGEVVMDEYTATLAEYYSIIGNIRPVTISIQDILPTSTTGAKLGGGVFDAQTLDDAGGCVEQFYYMTEEDGVEVDGWYNEDGETLATLKLNPGEGIMINNTTGADAIVTYSAL